MATEEERADALRFRYIEPNLTLTNAEIKEIRDENLGVLLNSRKLQVVLDLDRTLIHARKTEKLTLRDKNRMKMGKDVYEEVLRGSYAVKLRPGIREFVENVKSMFDVTVYTMGGRVYGEAIHELLVTEAGFPKDSWVICQHDCLKNDPEHKSLEIVLSHERVVVVVDDTVEVWAGFKKNLIQIGPYNFFGKVNEEEYVDDDAELGRVMTILRRLHASFYKGIGSSSSSSSSNNNDQCSVLRNRDVRDILVNMIGEDDDDDHHHHHQSGGNMNSDQNNLNGKRIIGGSDIIITEPPPPPPVARKRLCRKKRGIRSATNNLVVN